MNYYLIVLSMVSMFVTTSTTYMVLPVFFKDHDMSGTQVELLISVVTFLFAFTGKDFTTFAALRFIEGFAFYITPVAITTMVADIFPSRQSPPVPGGIQRRLQTCIR